MSESTPLVSVAMSVYNAAQYLEAAIESILNQTFTDFEFIIIDDGSTDRSLHILQRYAQCDPRIDLISRENQGISRTRNEILTRSRGELIAVMDADDVALPNRFLRQVKFLDEHPEVVCVGGAIDWIDEKGKFVGHCAMPESDAAIQTLLLGGISMLHHPTTMVRRSAIVQAGGYDETLSASIDLDLWLRIGEIGQLANLPDTVLQYRLHPRSVTHAKQLKQTNDALIACQRAWQRRGITGKFIRTPTDHLHQHQFWLKCGWQGFANKQRDVARRCGLRAIATHPLDAEGWKLLTCALIKPLPSREKLKVKH